MKPGLAFAAVFVSLSMCAQLRAETLTIATVDNDDMMRMQELSQQFEKVHPDIDLEWVVMDENSLRASVSLEIVTGRSHFDILTIGNYEVPIWAGRGWLVPLDDLGPEFAAGDLLPPIRSALSHDGVLYAAPFYGESSFVMYRKDLFEREGIAMPEEPGWTFIAETARRLHDPEAGIYGICLRGLPGWGQNMAVINALANSMGARWFDMEWRPQFDTEAWRRTLQFYVDLLGEAGPPDPVNNGFQENLALFQQGKCAIWLDATVAGANVTNPGASEVADRTGFVLAPDDGRGKRANWLWTWSLAVPATSGAPDAAKKFIAWATSPSYSELVAELDGWANVPPGTRASLYENPQYRRAAPFAGITLRSIELADPEDPAVDPVPYTGVQFVSIPEYQYIGTTVALYFAAVLEGKMTVADALSQSQKAAVEIMRSGGYM